MARWLMVDGKRAKRYQPGRWLSTYQVLPSAIGYLLFFRSALPVVNRVPCYISVMGSDLQALFANLAEKERVKGHHSPEGRAIKILSRALNGWAAKTLSGQDVWVLCEQALKDWLKTRLRLSAWSTLDIADLGAAAAGEGLITNTDAEQLKRIASANSQLCDQVDRNDVECVLEFCIYLVEKHW